RQERQGSSRARTVRFPGLLPGVERLLDRSEDALELREGSLGRADRLELGFVAFAVLAADVPERLEQGEEILVEGRCPLGEGGALALREELAVTVEDGGVEGAGTLHGLRPGDGAEDEEEGGGGESER